MEAIAKLKNVPTSPRKMRLVVDLIRGMDVNKALALLKFEAKEGAGRVEKLLLSAIANWENKYTEHSLEDSKLYIKTIQVDGGKQVKRFRPAPRGVGHRIRKRSNHITLVIDNRLDLTSETEEIK